MAGRDRLKTSPAVGVENMTLSQTRFAAGRYKSVGGVQSLAGGRNGIHTQPIDFVVDAVASDNKAFMKSVRNLTQLKLDQEKVMRRNLNVVATSSLDAYIAYQKMLLDEEQAKKEGQEDEAGGDSNKKPSSKKLLPMPDALQLDVSTISYETVNDIRVPVGGALHPEKQEVFDALEKTLGNSPRGMSYLSAVTSPKRGSVLQQMLEKAMWTDLHESAYQNHKKRKLSSRGNLQTSSAHVLMGGFLSLNEFREIHVSSLQRERAQKLEKFHRRRRARDEKKRASMKSRKPLFWDQQEESSGELKKDSGTDQSVKDERSRMQQILDDHNLHLHGDVNANEPPKFPFSDAEFAIAKRELASFIIKTRGDYIDKFIQKREQYLIHHIAKQRDSAGKRKEKAVRAAKTKVAREKMFQEVQRTRRRLRNIERRPVPRMEKKANSKKIHERQHSTTPANKTQPVKRGRRSSIVAMQRSSQAKKTHSIDQMSRLAKKYCDIVRSKGGGVWAHPSGLEFAKMELQACLRIQAIFRGRIARKYLVSLSWIEDPYHLGIVLKRYETDPGVFDAKNMPQLLEDLGREKPGPGVREKLQVMFDPAFEGVISIPEFKQYFLNSRGRNPTAAVMIRLNHRVKSLQHKEYLLLNKKQRRTQFKSTNGIQVDASNSEVSSNHSGSTRCLSPISQRPPSPTHARHNDSDAKLGDNVEQEHKSQQIATSQEKRLGEVEEEAATLEASIATKRSDQAPVAAPQATKISSRRPKSTGPNRKGTPKRTNQQEPNEAKKKPKKPASGIPRVKRKAKPVPDEEEELRKARAPAACAKRFEHQIQMNLVLAHQLEESRQQVKLAARNLWKDKIGALTSVLEAIGQSTITGGRMKKIAGQLKSDARLCPAGGPDSPESPGILDTGIQKAFDEYQFEKFKNDALSGGGSHIAGALSFEDFKLLRTNSAGRLVLNNSAEGDGASPWDTDAKRLKNLRHVTKDLRYARQVPSTTGKPKPKSFENSVLSKGHKKNRMFKSYLKNDAKRNLNKIRTDLSLLDCDDETNVLDGEQVLEEKDEERAISKLDN